jgi:hypothetical protein
LRQYKYNFRVGVNTVVIPWVTQRAGNLLIRKGNMSLSITNLLHCRLLVSHSISHSVRRNAVILLSSLRSREHFSHTVQRISEHKTGYATSSFLYSHFVPPDIIRDAAAIWGTTDYLERPRIS